MEKEFVIYELAVKLKELGFNEPCFGYYSDSELVFNTHTNNEMQRFRYSAPTFSQAFRWFREKYGLDNWVYKSRDYTYFCSILKDGNLFPSIGFTTYEEAELECLEKLIEIVEGIESQK